MLGGGSTNDDKRNSPSLSPRNPREITRESPAVASLVSYHFSNDKVAERRIFIEQNQEKLSLVTVFFFAPLHAQPSSKV
jgi:hypothetical protein